MILEQQNRPPVQAPAAGSATDRLLNRRALSSRQRHDEAGAGTDPCASCFNGSRVEPDEVAHDSKAKPQAAIAARRAALRLAKAVEHMRQKARIDANAGVLHLNASLSGLWFCARAVPTGGGPDLDGVGQKIPEDLLEACRVREPPGVSVRA